MATEIQKSKFKITKTVANWRIYGDVIAILRDDARRSGLNRITNLVNPILLRYVRGEVCRRDEPALVALAKPKEPTTWGIYKEVMDGLASDAARQGLSMPVLVNTILIRYVRGEEIKRGGIQ